LKKWLPVKENLVVLKKNAEPYIEKVSTRSIEFYESSKDTVTPHIVKVKEFAHPYYQVLLALRVQLQPSFTLKAVVWAYGNNMLCLMIAIWNY
jgi:hypothetical protein